ncbi:hypothetical protein ACFL6S_18945, partial [Candidatus Poribacteria bacterium]
LYLAWYPSSIAIQGQKAGRRGGEEMNPESMKPYGLALLDYLNGDHSARITIHRVTVVTQMICP